MIKLTTEREITPYVWVHPEDDRSRVVASTASPARPSSRRNFASRAMHSNGRGRDEDYSSPPAQVPACAANAPGFPRVKRRRHMVLKLHALRRTAANRIDVVARLSVRTRPPVGCSPRVRPFPPRPPPEVAFLCSVASSVLRPHPTSHPRTCSACGFCLPEPARHKSGHG